MVSSARAGLSHGLGLARAAAALALAIVLAVTYASSAHAVSTKTSNWPNSPRRHTLRSAGPLSIPSFAENLRGDVATTGNTLETCPANLSASRRHRTTRGGTRATEPCIGNNNNDENMVYVNVDPGGGRFNSSTATLELPAGATIVRAFLYWAADLSCGINRPCDSTTPAQQNAPDGDNVSNNSKYTTVEMQAGSGSYTTIDATASGRDGAWADVPELVQPAR